MINPIKYLLVAIYFLLCLSASHVKAQPDYRLIKFEANFPVRGNFSYVEYAKRTSVYIDTFFEVAHPEFFLQKKVKDTLFFEFNSTDGSIPVIWKVHFLIDSLSHNLKDVYLKYMHGWNGQGGGSYPYDYKEYFYETSSVLFSTLPYQYLTGDTLVVNDSGLACKETIESVYYELRNSISGSYDPRNPPKSIDDISTTLNDTYSDFRCSIVLSKVVLSANVFATTTSDRLLAERYIHSNDIHITFPATDHANQLIICDILGRTVTTIDIHPGETEYSLPSIKFQNGPYFAKLGSLTTHF